jgi:hypothetical protein
MNEGEGKPSILGIYDTIYKPVFHYFDVYIQLYSCCAELSFDSFHVIIKLVVIETPASQVT